MSDHGAAQRATTADAPAVLRVEMPTSEWRSLAEALAEGSAAARLRDGTVTSETTVRELDRLRRLLPTRGHATFDPVTLSLAQWDRVAAATEDAACALRERTANNSSQAADCGRWSRAAACLSKFANEIAAARTCPEKTVWRISPHAHPPR